MSKRVAVLRLVLGDQCSAGLAALADLDPAADVVLMAEVMEECSYVRHHPKKIVLVLSAMRHFAAQLRAKGVRVDYVALGDAGNTGSLRGEVARAVARHRPERVVVTEPGEWRLLDEMQSWQERLGVEVRVRQDTRFVCKISEFRAWAAGKSTLRMEFFYREMRRRTGLLMDGDAPLGERWNFDAENRKRLPTRLDVPAPVTFEPDSVTQAVVDCVRDRFPGHFGVLENFDLPVTAAEAARALADFITHRLAQFGDWQDAMKTGEPVLFHARISAAMNAGLLDPLEACRAAEAAYAAGRAPLNAVEGFIRQIIGWREFMRGIYWLRMPGYASANALEATRTLPQFYWDGQTRMNCMRQTILDTREHAYAHHIQRLMITGNFALLAGLHPDEVDEWYMIVYADAYEWVEMPNVRGMALFADGGVVGSKPYAASGAYINRMSDYCGACHYDVKEAVGEQGCPFNALYWDFMARHAERFAHNTRLAMPLKNLARMDEARVAALRQRAARFLKAMDAGEEV